MKSRAGPNRQILKNGPDNRNADGTHRTDRGNKSTRESRIVVMGSLSQPWVRDSKQLRDFQPKKKIFGSMDAFRARGRSFR